MEKNSAPLSKLMVRLKAWRPDNYHCLYITISDQILTILIKVSA